MRLYLYFFNAWKSNKKRSAQSKNSRSLLLFVSCTCVQHHSFVARLPLLSFLPVYGCCGTRFAQTVLALYPSTVRDIRSVFDSADSLRYYLCVLFFSNSSLCLLYNHTNSNLKNKTALLKSEQASVWVAEKGQKLFERWPSIVAAISWKASSFVPAT